MTRLALSQRSQRRGYWPQGTSPLPKVGEPEWQARGEHAWKLVSTSVPGALGWVIYREGHGWFGRLGNNFLFGPASLARAKAAVDARLRAKDFARLANERLWPVEALDFLR
jgi:hypothetical protein